MSKVITNVRALSDDIPPAQNFSLDPQGSILACSIEKHINSRELAP